MNNKGSGILAFSLKFFRHRIKSGFRNGYNIHSPFVYDLVRNVIFNHAGMYVPDEVLEFHRKQKKNPEKLEINDRGAGSRVEKSAIRSVSSIVKKSSVTIKLGKLLYRLSAWYKPEIVLEFGTGLGISTNYLASGAGEVPFISIEGSREKHDFASRFSKVGRSSPIQYILGDFNAEFGNLIGRSKNHMLVFIDGDHRYHSTIDKVDAFLKQEGVEEMLIILDDIYWSDEMQQAWEECLSRQEVAISLDLFYFGILIKRRGIEKQHFRIKF